MLSARGAAVELRRDVDEAYGWSAEQIRCEADAGEVALDATADARDVVH